MLKNVPFLVIIIVSLWANPSMLNASQQPQEISATMVAQIAAMIAAAAQPVMHQAPANNAPGAPALSSEQLRRPAELDGALRIRARHAHAAPAAQQPASMQEPYPTGWVFPTDMAAITPEEEGLLSVAHPLMSHLGIDEIRALMRVSKRVRIYMQSIIRENPVIRNALVRYRETYGQPIVIRPDFDDASEFDVFAQQFYTQLRAELSGKTGCHVGIDLSGIEDLRLLAPDVFANFMHTIHRTIVDSNCSFVRLRAREIGLEKVDPSIFAGMHDLEEIDLTRNDIDSLCGDTFKGLTKLTCLTLDAALGDTMGDPNHKAPVVLNGLTNLQDLVLYGCHLDDDSLPDTIFDTLKKLKRLVLGFNYIQAPRPRLFQDLRALQVLDLSICDMETLDKDLFKNLHALKTLRVHGCQSIAELPQEIFSGLTKLKTLDVSENAFTEFPTMALRNLTSLRTLSIGCCPLEELPEDALLGLINLKKLDLSHCQLRQLPAGLLRSTKNLKNLDLSFNMLTELPSDIFRHLTRLTLLDIRRNRFAPTQLRRSLAGLRHICAAFDEEQETVALAIPALEGVAAPEAPEDELADA